MTRPARAEMPTLDDVRERVTIPAPASLTGETALIIPPKPAASEAVTTPAPPDNDAGRLGRWHDLYATFDRLDPERQVDAKVIAADLAHMGPNARAMLVAQSQRFRHGAILYQADFDTDRDDARDSFEEAADGIAYSLNYLRKHPGDPIAEAMLSAFETAGKLAMILAQRTEAEAAE